MGKEPKIQKNDVEQNFHIINGKIIQSLLAPTAVISALGYFLGWSVNASYYLTFGLSPGLMQKSVSEIVSAAWIELVLGVVGIVLGVIFYRFVVSNFEYRKGRKKYLNRNLLLRFFISIALSCIGAILFIYANVVSPIRLRYLFLLGVAIGFFWIATVYGTVIRTLKSESKVGRFFYIIYPNQYVYLTILLLAFVYSLSMFGVWRGAYLAQRDIDVPGNLSSVVIYSVEEIALKGTYDPDAKYYIYDDLELIDANEKFLFVLNRFPASSGNKNTNQNSTFVIPRESGIIFELGY